VAVVFLDRQHAGKPGRRAADRGASADLDGDGTIDTDELEAILTMHYLTAAEVALLEDGHTVVPISDGWYSARHDRVNAYSGTFGSEYGPQVYVAAHLNAGWGGRPGKGYGSVFYDVRSRRGIRLAVAIARELRLVAPELSEAKAIECKPDGWTRGAFGTIGGVVRPVGICYEPAFLDCPAHADLLGVDGLRAMGTALAHGIDKWAATQ